MRVAGLSVLLLLTACKDGCSDGIGSTESENNNPNNIAVPTRDPDETFAGDLSTGTEIDLDWADENPFFCWPGTENVNFTGAHVFFTRSKEGSGDYVIKATPDAGVDISLYTLEFNDEVQTPPDVTSTTRCEASYDADGDSNPGGWESVELFGFADNAVLIGVAGANGQDSGAFTVEVWQDSAEGFDETGE